MYKIILRWIIVFAGSYTIIYNLGYIFFDIGDTSFIRRTSSLIGAIFFFSILLYWRLKDQEKKSS